MSHSACKPVSSSVVGQRLEAVADIRAIHEHVLANSFDLLQTDHTLSGIDMALWDLLGKKEGTPVWALSGQKENHPKLPYASLLFGDDPAATHSAVRRLVADGYRAIKLGWGPFGRHGVAADVEQIVAAREALGPDNHMMVDAGTIFGEDVESAAARMDALANARVHWFEEPFVGGAFRAYHRLAADNRVAIAGGEGCHSPHQAEHMIDHAGVRFIQIDTGRLGGITPALRVARYAEKKGVVYVNHTFTTHLALAASLVPFVGMKDHEICEYPVEQKPLARDLCQTRILRDGSGRIRLPDAPGLGVQPDPAVLKQYLVDTEIKVGGKVLYRTPQI